MEGRMINRLIQIAGWSLLWLVSLWIFLVVGFPDETARDWLAESLGKQINAAVSIGELRIKWDLDVKIRGISINGRQSAAGSQEPSPFTVQLASMDISPKLLSLIRLKPALDFNAGTPSGGNISGSYDTDELSISFKDVSFKDISISTLPVPSGTRANGSGRFKFIKVKGTVEVEVDGVPGGKQRFKVPGNESSQLDGKLKVTVSLPKL